MSLNTEVTVVKRVIVEYDLPGMIVTESTRIALDSRDVQAAIALAPQNAFSFTIHEEYEGTLVAEGQTVPMTSGPVNRSGRYFIDAVVLDEEGLRREGMTDYSPGTVVKSRLGNKTFFSPDKDQVVSS
jgi:hypothetical protein